MNILSPIHVGDSIMLQPLKLDDAAEVYCAIDTHRDYLSVWLPFVPLMKCVDDIEAYIRLVSDARNLEDCVFAIREGADFVGLIGLKNIELSNHRAEIGYWMLPEYGGRGIMTCSVRYLMRWAIGELGMNRFQICCGVANYPSNAIPRRLGFVLEGVQRDAELLASGKYHDVNQYSILRRELNPEDL